MLLVPITESSVHYLAGEESTLRTKSYAFERIERTTTKVFNGKYLQNQVEPDLRSNILKYTEIND
jgi:hypothetical protein